VLAGISVVLLLIGLFVLKPGVSGAASGADVGRVHGRPPRQSEKAMSVWFIVEGAGTLASVGFS
jgi:hypothetical protein